MSVTTTSLAPRSGSLGVQLAAHLQRRASFHLTKPRIDALAAMTANTAVNTLFDNPVPTPYIPRPLDPNTFSTSGGEWIDNNSNDSNFEGARRRYVAGWWFRNAIHDPSATHKLAFFIHTFFTVSYQVSGAGNHYNDISRHFYDHLALLNYAAENNMNLKTLAKKMTLDNQMLFYLQNRLNKASGVNENYAREFLELFTIAPGEQLDEAVYTNYTEADINEFARLLTGFTVKSTRNTSDIDPDTGIFTGYADPALHDSGDKTFSDNLSGNGQVTITGRSDATGMIDELDEFINMVFNRTETARNYAQKMYRFYVATNISDAIENSVIDGLTNHLIANNYDLVATLKLLLKSEHFYSMCTDTEGGGNIIKSPLELLSETLSFFNTDLPALSSSPTLEELENHFQSFINVYLYAIFGVNVGLQLFDPVNVAGYPAYYQEPLRDKNWYNGTTIPTRYGIGKLFISNQNYIDNVLYTYIDTLAYANYLVTLGVDLSNADEVVDAMVNYLLPQPLNPERRDIIKNIFLNNLSPINWQFVWQAYIGDVNNMGDEARLYLDALVTAVLSAQEFQLK